LVLSAFSRVIETYNPFVMAPEVTLNIRLVTGTFEYANEIMFGQHCRRKNANKNMELFSPAKFVFHFARALSAME
jgi:hypothetical protein